METILMPGKIDSCGLSDVGKVRKVNEDQFLIADLNKSMLIHQTTLNFDDESRLFGDSQGQLFLVADGMGGHAAGKRASTIAVNSLAASVLNAMSWPPDSRENRDKDLKQELQAAMEYCQQQIEACATANVETKGMGTTLTMAYVLWPEVYVVHVGDSRCYLLHNDKLEQITTDQTLAQQLVEQGALQPSEAKGSRFSHVLMSCLGGGKSGLRTQIHKRTLTYGDTLLLCTDGLTTCVPDEKVRTLLGRNERSRDICRRLIDAGNDSGSPDNLTVVVVRLGHTQPESPQVSKQQAILEDDPVEPDVIPVPLAIRCPAPGLGEIVQSWTRKPSRPGRGEKWEPRLPLPSF
jgi:serine/threonine protein phosphatase PrpC